MAYNQDQWIASFEGRLSILRPHLSQRLLETMSLSAWHRHGTKGEDPIKAAEAESKALDAASSNPRKTRLGAPKCWLIGRQKRLRSCDSQA